MRFYIGTCVKEDAFILTELNKLRDDIGICVSAYEYLTRKATRNIVAQFNGEIPIILDNGQIQAYRRGLLFPQDKILEIAQGIKPEFTFAPDRIGNPDESVNSLLAFIKDHDDLELLAPLQAHNNGLLQIDKLFNEIAVLKEAGYEKFGIGKPYEIKFTRRETAEQFLPRIRPKINYMHFMGYPIGQGLSGINLCDSVDMGTFWILKTYRVGIYKNPREGAELLSALIDVDKVVSKLHNKKHSSLDEVSRNYDFSCCGALIEKSEVSVAT